MTHSEHTPGPFEVRRVRNVTVEGPCHPVVNPDGFPVAFVPAWEDAAVEAEANARLFAAAPALLEALEPFADACRDCIDDDERDSSSTWEHPVGMSLSVADFRRARAAITLAKQGQDNG